MNHRASLLSEQGKARLTALPGDPLFLADWDRALFMHFEVDPEVLQTIVPLPLDLHHGRAYVSLVAFTMRDLRPKIGGKWTRGLLAPIATHRFLNLRTYVRQPNGGEPGIYFIAEWIPNRIAAFLGPRTFGLPYRMAQVDYQHTHETGLLRGEVIPETSDKGTSTRLAYQAEAPDSANYQPCQEGTLDAFLLERYTAYTMRFGKPCFFRVWHSPWAQTPVRIQFQDLSLLTSIVGPARFIGANYSPGATNVWMSRPHKLSNQQPNHAS